MPNQQVPPSVPPLNSGPIPQPNSAAREAAELRVLNSEAKSRDLANSEQEQKIWIRKAAIWAGFSVILIMTGILVWLVCKTFWGPMQFENPAVGVAMVVAPIVSITAIVIAILVGAFRKFDEKDLEKIAAASSGAAGLYTNIR